MAFSAREISDRMMECISDETAKDNERRALIGEEETKEEEAVTFPTLSPTTPESIPTPRSTKKLWVPNKVFINTLFVPSNLFNLDRSSSQIDHWRY